MDLDISLVSDRDGKFEILSLRDLLKEKFSIKTGIHTDLAAMIFGFSLLLTVDIRKHSRSTEPPGELEIFHLILTKLSPTWKNSESL